MKQFFIYLAVSFLIQSASAQTPTSSPEVRNGDYAIRKQASHDEISGGAWISYTLSFSLPANSGPVTITDNFTLPAATTINPLLWSSINIAGGLNVLQAFTVNVNGRSGTCILENISNAAISSIITFNVAAPNGDVFDGNLLANQVTMTGQGGAINLTTAAVNTLIRVGNPFGTSITRVWQNASSTLGSCFVLPNGHYVVLYEINLFVNQGSACYFANGLSLSFPVASPFAGAGTPTVTDAQELANNNWNPISVPALQSGNLVFNLVGNPAGYYGRRQSFRITVDYGVLTPTAVANIPASVQLNGTQNNTPFSAAANTTHCVISPTPGNGPVDPLPCNDPNNTLGQTALYPTAMLGCTDNSWTTQITNNKCSGIQTLFFDEIIPSGLMVNGIQYRTPNVVAFNPVGGAAGVTETVTVYNASGNSAVIAPNYIQGTFFNCAIPANVPIAGGQVVRITVALSGENIAITQTATLIMGVSIPFGVPLGNIQNTTSVLTDAGMGNREWTGTASSTFEVIPPGPRMCTWKYNCDPNKLYNPASVATASSPAVAGGHVRFLLAVMNTGSAPLNNATFTDVLPAGFTYVPNSATYFTIPSGDMHNYCAS